MIYLNKNREISFEEWRKIVTSLNLREKLDQARSIVIKPNFAAGTYADPKTHVMTDLRLLRSCIVFLADENPQAIIYIAEADSTCYGFAYLKFEHLGLPGSLDLPVSLMERVRLLDMSRDCLVKCCDAKFRLYTSIDRQLFLSKILMESDFFISLSNLKTHAVTGYTGACKNLFGCLPDFDKSVNHPRISKVIHDLVVAIKPNLNIVDAFYGMERNGPVQGKDVDSCYRVISDNAVEADIYAAKTIGYPTKKIGYLKLLCKTFGMTLESDAKVVKKYAKPALFLRLMNAMGVAIQGFGQSMALFGHRIHSCPTPIALIITIARPILLKFFDYEKLKVWKRRIFK